MKKNIFAENLDDAVLNQFDACMGAEFCSDGALMPDAHYGYVAPIGAVLITKGIVVPSWVGYDIGCGVIAIKLKGKNLFNEIKKNAKKIHTIVSKSVPMGLGKMRAEHSLSLETKKEFEKLISKVEKKAHNSELINYIN
jgi:tRNA-splicing ligase RtcB